MATVRNLYLADTLAAVTKEPLNLDTWNDVLKTEHKLLNETFLYVNNYTYDNGARMLSSYLENLTQSECVAVYARG